MGLYSHFYRQDPRDVFDSVLTDPASLREIRLWAQVADDLAWSEMHLSALLSAFAFNDPKKLDELDAPALLAPSTDEVVKRAAILFGGPH